MRDLYLLICLSYCLGLVSMSHAQSTRQLCSFPNVLEENSGMYISDPNSIWLHNDSGDSSYLYQVDTSGNLLSTLFIENASHVDWEDLARDNSDNLYIGDFGNNNNDRQNLRIYKIPSPSSVSNDTIQAEIIEFSYDDQTAFPPADPLKNYDLEAFVWMNDSLYLFTKNRTNPYDGFTRLYKLPATQGTHIATFVDSFDTQQTTSLLSITSASLSPSKDYLALLNGAQAWIFYDYTGSNFFDGQVATFNLGTVSQKEAIAFVSDSLLYYSDEKTFINGGNLYALDISSWLESLNTSTSVQDVAAEFPFLLFPNPSTDLVFIQHNSKTAVDLRLYDLNGRMLIQKNTLDSPIRLEVNQLPEGTYLLQLNDGSSVRTERLQIR